MLKRGFILFAIVAVAAACGSDQKTGRKKKAVKAVSAEWYALSVEKAVYRKFRGDFRQLERSAAELYKWVKQQGMTTGGPIVLQLDKGADLQKSNMLDGRLWLPVLDIKSPAAYKGAKNLRRPAFGKFPVGNYFSICYSGDPDAIDVAYEELKNEADKKDVDLQGVLFLMFEEPSDRISSSRVLRLLQKGKK